MEIIQEREGKGRHQTSSKREKLNRERKYRKEKNESLLQL